MSDAKSPLKVIETVEDLETAVISNDASRLTENPHLKSCWEVMKCEKKRCSVYGKPPTRCWLVDGTNCNESRHLVFENKWQECKKCPVFTSATPTVELRMQEMINNIISFSQSSYPKTAIAEYGVRSQDIMAFAAQFKLTDRESAIVPLILERLTREEISKIAGVSPETVKTHVKRIYRKCGVGSRKSLISRIKETLTPETEENLCVSSKRPV